MTDNESTPLEPENKIPEEIILSIEKEEILKEEIIPVIEPIEIEPELTEKEKAKIEKKLEEEKLKKLYTVDFYLKKFEKLRKSRILTDIEIQFLNDCIKVMEQNFQLSNEISLGDLLTLFKRIFKDNDGINRYFFLKL